MPVSIAAATKCHRRSISSAFSTAIAISTSASPACTAASVRRRSTRAATTPPRPPHASITSPSMPKIAPTQNGESVTSSTSQPVAMTRGSIAPESSSWWANRRHRSGVRNDPLPPGTARSVRIRFLADRSRRRR